MFLFENSAELISGNLGVFVSSYGSLISKSEFKVKTLTFQSNIQHKIYGNGSGDEAT